MFNAEPLQEGLARCKVSDAAGWQPGTAKGSGEMGAQLLHLSEAKCRKGVLTVKV